jgi:type VI secretion system protein ImpF
VASARWRAAVGQFIKATIERYEPRLRAVRVVLLTPEPDAKMAVKFRIDAKLAIDPAPEVAFETILELTTGKCEVTPPGAG